VLLPDTDGGEEQSSIGYVVRRGAYPDQVFARRERPEIEPCRNPVSPRDAGPGRRTPWSPDTDAQSHDGSVGRRGPGGHTPPVEKKDSEASHSIRIYASPVAPAVTFWVIFAIASAVSGAEPRTRMMYSPGGRPSEGAAHAPVWPWRSGCFGVKSLPKVIVNPPAPGNRCNYPESPRVYPSGPHSSDCPATRSDQKWGYEDGIS